MRKVDQYILGTLVKTAAGTTALCTLMLVSVQMFQHLDAFLRNQTPLKDLLRLAVLYVPSSIVLVFAPALLFAAAYTFSQLSANNELICLYNATYSQRRLVFPVLLAGILCCVLQFAVQEWWDIPAQHVLSQVQTEIIGVNSTRDKKEITLGDWEQGYVFHAARYTDERRRADRVVVVLLDARHQLQGRVNARSATYQNDGSWLLRDVDSIQVDMETMAVEREHHDTYTIDRLTLEPQLLKDNSSDIKTMSIPVARKFLARMRKLDHAQWQSYAVDFSQRMLGCLAPLVMLFIACTMNYRFKKNVLLFTIILSLCLAVVYYVVQMMSLILARQGVVGPVAGMLLPMAITPLFVLASQSLLRRFL